MRTPILFALVLMTACTTSDSIKEGSVSDLGTSDFDDDTGEEVIEIESVVTYDECEFEVMTTEGEALMGNTLTIRTMQGANDGAQTPQEDLRTLVVGFETDDEECSTLTVWSYQAVVVWTDKAGTGWKPTNIDMMFFRNIPFTMEVVDVGGLILVNVETEMEILPGDLEGLSVMMDTLGASSELDDMVQVGIHEVVVGDGDDTWMLANPGVGGAPIVF